MAKVFTCSHPELRLRCAFCGCVFLCGEAPHDEEGSLCPECGRGEDLEDMDQVRYRKR